MQAEQELLWAILPEGLGEYFEVEGYEKDKESFKIILVEKNTVPTNLPTEYQGRRVENNVLSAKTINDFPIRGRKTQLTLKKRYWKFTGVAKLYSRPITTCFTGTKLEQEFANFLKGED
jgi:hypothetical protein